MNSPVSLSHIVSCFGPKLTDNVRESIEINHKILKSGTFTENSKQKTRFSLKSGQISNNHSFSHNQQLTSKQSSKQLESSSANSDISNGSFREFYLQNPDQKQVKNPKKRNWIKTQRFLDGMPFNVFLLIITIFSLFGSDIETAFFSKDSTIYFDILKIFSFLVFTFEFIVSSYAKSEYFGSFFFYLDLISTLSILLDITWIQPGLFSITSSNSTTRLVRASRATRMGTRAGRVVRMVRLVRIFKMYKSAMKTKTGKDKSKELLKTKTLLFDKKKSMLFDRSNSLRNKSQSELKWYMSPDTSPKKKNVIGFDLGQIKQLKNNNKVKKSTIKRASKGFFGLNFGKKRQSQTISIITPQKERISVIYDESKTKTIKINEINDDELLNQIEEEMKLKESKVGKKISNLTMMRVIIIVLLLLIVVPLLSSAYWSEPVKCFEYGIIEMSNFYNQNLFENNTLKIVCENYINAYEYPLIYLRTPPFFNCSIGTNNFDKYREEELLYSFLVDENNNIIFEAAINFSSNSQINSIINITRTIFVSLVLTISAIYFTKDVNELIIFPVERMIQKVNKMAENPLLIMDQKFVQEKDFEHREIQMIEDSIIKITTLLALGFGEAGKEIIAINMAKGGDLDYAMKGKKKYAIFGFCDIRNFTDATEVLQEDVMIFVNNVAEIVHSLIDRYGGTANKNIGDAFLLVWKFRDNLAFFLEDDQENEIPNQNKKVSDICDLALLSFVKIIAKLNRSPKILKYRKDARLLTRIKGYKVKLGFGLHLGWAIEGAIGSSFKIDASYLSPHVNVSSRLEAATKQYGVPLLISEELHRYLSERLQIICRMIDFVTLKGFNKPIHLFTLDLYYENLNPGKDKSDMTREDIREINMIKKTALLEGIENENFQVEDILDNDRDIKLLFKKFDVNFHSTFHEAIKCYIEGNWSKAIEKFNICLNFNQNDGPSHSILEFMKMNNYIKPENWNGFRILTEK